MILRKRAVVLLAASAPGLGLAQGGFVTYDTVFESLPVIPPLSPGDEARREVMAAVRRGEVPAADAPRVIREMAAGIAATRGRIVLTGTTVAGSADGTVLYTTFLPALGPKGGPTPIVAEPAWEMMRAGITYRLDRPGALQVSAGDDLRFLSSMGMRWLLLGGVPPATLASSSPIRALAAGRSVHSLRSRPLKAEERAQGFPPHVERLEIVWERGRPQRVLVLRGFGRAGLQFRVEVAAWSGDRPARFTVEEMDEGTKILRRRTHTLTGISRKVPDPLKSLRAGTRVFDGRLRPERPTMFVWAGSLVPLDELRGVMEQEDALDRASRIFGARRFDGALYGAAGVAGGLALLALRCRKRR